MVLGVCQIINKMQCDQQATFNGSPYIKPFLNFFATYFCYIPKQIRKIINIAFLQLIEFYCQMENRSKVYNDKTLCTPMATVTA